jgi:ferritin-like metal-binding protein YciE
VSESDDIRTARDLFLYELEAVYDTEVRLVDVLDELSAAATNENLSAGFALHRTETERQARRAEQAFEALGVEPGRRNDPLADGLVARIEQFDARAEDDELRNLYFLVAGLQTERVEITNYEGLLLAAESADLPDAATAPLEASLREERKTLRKLNGLAGESDLRSIWRVVSDL